MGRVYLVRGPRQTHLARRSHTPLAHPIRPIPIPAHPPHPAHPTHPAVPPISAHPTIRTHPTHTTHSTHPAHPIARIPGLIPSHRSIPIPCEPDISFFPRSIPARMSLRADLMLSDSTQGPIGPRVARGSAVRTRWTRAPCRTQRVWRRRRWRCQLGFPTVSGAGAGRRRTFGWVSALSFNRCEWASYSEVWEEGAA